MPPDVGGNPHEPLQPHTHTLLQFLWLMRIYALCNRVVIIIKKHPPSPQFQRLIRIYASNSWVDSLYLGSEGFNSATCEEKEHSEIAVILASCT